MSDVRVRSMRMENAYKQCVLGMRGMRTMNEHEVCGRCMRTMHAYMDASELCVRGMRTRYAYEVAMKSLQLLFFGFPQPRDYQNRTQREILHLMMSSKLQNVGFGTYHTIVKSR